MKQLLTIFLIPFFVSVQSMAAVCSVKCSIGELATSVDSQTAENQENKQHSCHQTTQENGDNQTDEENDCGSMVCEIDDFVQSEIGQIDLQKMLVVSTQITAFESLLVPQNSILGSSNYANGPPGFGSYINTPIIIQKSSFLI